MSAGWAFPAALLRPAVRASPTGGLFDALARRYDWGNRIISLGQDLRWKRRAVALLGRQADGIYLDCGAGTGDLARLMQQASGGRARVVALDTSKPMLQAGHPGPRTHPVVGDAQRIPLRDGSIDSCVTGFLLRNLPDLPAFFAAVGRVLKPGGRLVVLEIAYPPGSLRRRLFGAYFHGVAPILGGLATGQWSAYRYLSRSLRTFPTPAELAELARRAGLHTVGLRQGRWTGLFLLTLEKPTTPGR